MNLWAGLLVNRNKLPCVGRPLDANLPLEEDYEEVFEVADPQTLRPNVKLKVGDFVGTWELKRFISGSKHVPAKWLCVCHCGCNQQREIRTTTLNARTAIDCQKGYRKSV